MSARVTKPPGRLGSATINYGTHDSLRIGATVEL